MSFSEKLMFFLIFPILSCLAFQHNFNDIIFHNKSELVSYLRKSEYVSTTI